MDKNSSDSRPKDISVKISNDRGKICINVTGDISASSAVECVKHNLPEVVCENFFMPDITAVSGGYAINIIGRKSVKDYLAECPVVSCKMIFSIAETAKSIFDTYGKICFSQILFDYNVILLKNNSLENLDFVFAPFSYCDDKLVKFSELLMLLFIHMDEDDTYSEDCVKKLIDRVSKWEKENYKEDACREFEICLEEYRNAVTQKQKKDLFSKGSHPIRFLFGSLHGNTNLRNKRTFYISFDSACEKSIYTYQYNPQEEYFFCINKGNVEKDKNFKSLKVGREKKWAVIHIEDMTVSGRYGEILFDNGNFVLMPHHKHLPEQDALSENRTAYILRNGQKLQIGKMAYTVKIHSSTR